jgi:hypothetical protein
MLVAAVLRPEEREDGELEVVRLPLEQLADSVELPVREAEGAMERLFCDPRQVPKSSCAPGRGAVRGTIDRGRGGPVEESFLDGACF